MSYAPDPARSARAGAQSTAYSRTTWILCRRWDTFPIADDAALVRCAERGRIQPDDYLVDPRFDVCIQAKEMADLREVFRRRTIQRLEKISWLVAWGWQLFND